MPYVTYPALVERETGSDGAPVYGVVFPDLPGCVAVEPTLQGALRSAEQALALHIAGMLADGDPLPEPHPVEERRDQLVAWLGEDGAAAIVHVALVTAPVPGPPKRINITLDETLIEEIDAVTNNRSAFLATAARAELDKRKSHG